MTDEQCLQVAELWGWEYHEGDWYQPTPNTDWPKGLKVCTEAGIKSQVNSWSGFGRTVEAMAEKLYHIHVSPYNVVKFYHQPKSSGIEYSCIGTTHSDHLNNKKEIIEATHLAALETIDAEGS